MAPFPVEEGSFAISSSKLMSRESKPFDLAEYLSSLTLSEREALMHPPESSTRLTKRSNDELSTRSLADNLVSLAARDVVKPTFTFNSAAGSIPPQAINMKGVQAVIALIGASFVLGIIWFFFWAKNGGFQWRKGDWEEYKSTVLRRKGPNGTTLSNATKSTRLGGGSVVGDGYSDREGSLTDGTMTELSSEAPIIKEKQSKKNKPKNETAKDRKIREAKQAQWEGGHDYDVRAYRHEKVARVGGLNKDSDAQYYGEDYTETAPSEVHSNTHRQGHRQSSRQSSRQASPDKRQSRREFSYGDDSQFSAEPPAPPPRPTRYHSPSKNAPRPNAHSIPGSFNPDNYSDVQSQYTKSYHHPIPGLSGQGRPQGGYRRDRRDSLDD